MVTLVYTPPQPPLLIPNVEQISPLHILTKINGNWKYN